MKTLYHGTSSVNLSCIETIGLVPGHAKGGDQWAKEHHRLVGELSARREPSVFVADNARDAENFARYSAQEVGGDPIVITLHVPDNVFSAFKVDELFDDDGTVHAWRASHVDKAFVGEVRPAPRVDANEELEELMEKITLTLRRLAA